MKHIFLVLGFLGLAGLGVAQSTQATLKTGSAGNTAIVAIKPASAINGAKISTVNFAIAIPASVIPRPTVSIINNFNTNLTYNIDVIAGTQNIEAATPYYIYDFAADGNVSAGAALVNYTSGVDNNLVEIAFGGGPLATSTVKIVSLPNGGNSFNSSFYIANLGVDLTNYTSMYYGTSPVNSASGLAGLSYLNLAGVSLPTKFTNFLALKKDDNADLSWTVDNEDNNAYFDVQRSLDGRLFTDVTRVNALRNGRSLNTYSIPDLNISRLGSRVIYYRIKQVETSGDITYSEVRQLNLDKKNLTIGLYPNPVVSITKLVVDAPEAGKAFIIVRDATGKTVQQFNMDFVKGINQKDLNASMLPAGDYNVTVMGEKFNQTIKMTKGN